jgi:hypothetical protein
MKQKNWLDDEFKIVTSAKNWPNWIGRLKFWRKKTKIGDKKIGF